MNDSLQPWEKALSQLLEKIIEEGKEVPSAEIQALIDLYPKYEVEIRDTLKSVDLLDKILEVPTQADSALPTIKGFELRERIGLGGMGAVYRAYDTFLDREVAIKVIRAGIVSDRARARFIQEARTAVDLHHEGIVPVYSASEENGVPYIVMALVKGTPLNEFLSDAPHSPPPELENGNLAKSVLNQEIRKLLPAQRVAKIGEQISAALAYSHDRKVIHRDIKPANLILQPNGQVQLTDFGLSRLMVEDGEHLSISMDDTTPMPGEQLSRDGQIVGTLPFISPEIFDAQPASAESDIYALGVTLYQLLTDTLPHKEKSQAALIHSITSKKPLDPREIVPDIPIELEAIVLKSMEKNPNDRYESADALNRDFNRFLQGKPVKAPLRTRAQKVKRFIKQHRMAFLVVALACISSFAFLLNYLTRPGHVQYDLPASGIAIIDGEEVSPEKLRAGLPLGPGEHKVLLKIPHMFHETESFTVERGVRWPLTPRLLVEKGAINLTTTPPNAKAQIVPLEKNSGQVDIIGNTPFYTPLKHGEYKIHLDLNGFESQTFNTTVRPGMVVSEIDKVLVDQRAIIKVSNYPQNVKITAVDTSLLEVIASEDVEGGEKTFKIPAGRYHLTAIAPGFYPDTFRSIQVQPKEELSFHFNLNRQASFWKLPPKFSAHRSIQLWTSEKLRKHFLIVAGLQGEVNFIDLESGAEVEQLTVDRLFAGTPHDFEKLKRVPWHEPLIERTNDGKIRLISCLRGPPEIGAPTFYLSIFTLDFDSESRLQHELTYHTQVYLSRLGPVASQSFPYIALFKDQPDVDQPPQKVLALLEKEHLRLLRVKDGKELWKWPIPERLLVPAPSRLQLIDDDNTSHPVLAVLYRSRGEILALNLTDRKVAWSNDKIPDRSLVPLTVGKSGNDDIGPLIYFTPQGEKSFHAYRARDGKWLWNYVAPKPIFRSMAEEDIIQSVAGTEPLVQLDDGRFSLLDPSDGGIIWSTQKTLTETGSFTTTASSLLLRKLDLPFQHQDQILAYSPTGLLMSYSGDTGIPLWELESLISPQEVPLIGDVNLDGFPDFVVKGADGSLQSFPGPISRKKWVSQDGPGKNGRSLFLDINHDSLPEIIVYGNSFGPRAVQGTDGKLLWKGPNHARSCVLGLFTESDEPTLLSQTTKDSFVVIDTTSGESLFEFPTTDAEEFLVVSAPEKKDRLLIYTEKNPDENREASLSLWSLSFKNGRYSAEEESIKAPTFNHMTDRFITAGDLNQNSDVDFLILTSGENSDSFTLEAREFNKNKPLWKIDNFRYAPNGLAPEIDDYDGDGNLEIILSPIEGKIHCLDGATGKMKWEFPEKGSEFESELLEKFMFKSQPALWVSPKNAKARYLGLSTHNNITFLLDPITGKLRWARRLDAYSAEVSLADLNRDGVPELIAPTDKATLYTLAGQKGLLLWKIGIEHSTGTHPKIEDLDGDSWPEIVICTRNFKILTLEGRTIPLEESFKGRD